MDMNFFTPQKPQKKLKDKSNLTKLIAKCEKHVKDPPKLKQEVIFQMKGIKKPRKW